MALVPGRAHGVVTRAELMRAGITRTRSSTGSGRAPSLLSFPACTRLDIAPPSTEASYRFHRSRRAREQDRERERAARAQGDANRADLLELLAA